MFQNFCSISEILSVDSNVSVRKEALNCIQSIYSVYSNDINVQFLWMRNIFPSIEDTEDSIKEKVIEILEMSVFNEILTHPLSYEKLKEKKNEKNEKAETQKHDKNETDFSIKAIQTSNSEKLNTNLTEKFSFVIISKFDPHLSTYLKKCCHVYIQKRGSVPSNLIHCLQNLLCNMITLKIDILDFPTSFWEIIHEITYHEKLNFSANVILDVFFYFFEKINFKCFSCDKQLKEFSVAQSILNVMLNVYHNIDFENLEKIMKILLNLVENFFLTGSVIRVSFRLIFSISKINKNFDFNLWLEKLTKKIFKEINSFLKYKINKSQNYTTESTQTQPSKIISEKENAENDTSEFHQQEEDEDEDEKLCNCLLVLGEATLFVGIQPNSLYVTIVQALATNTVSALLLYGNENMENNILSCISPVSSPISSSAVLQMHPSTSFFDSSPCRFQTNSVCSPPLLLNASVRAAAFITLGKFCLVSDKLAKKKETIKIFVAHLHPSEDVRVRSNVFLVLTDMLVKYTSLVDEHFARICLSLADNSIFIRKQAIFCMTSLLAEDYIKFKGVLVHGFVFNLSDSDLSIRKICEFAFVRFIFPRYISKMAGIVVECICVLNQFYSHPCFASKLSHPTFSLLKNPEKKRNIYNFFLKNFSNVLRFQLKIKLVNDFLAVWIDNHEEKVNSFLLSKKKEINSNREFYSDDGIHEKSLNSITEISEIPPNINYSNNNCTSSCYDNKQLSPSQEETAFGALKDALWLLRCKHMKTNLSKIQRNSSDTSLEKEFDQKIAAEEMSRIAETKQDYTAERLVEKNRKPCMGGTKDLLDNTTEEQKDKVILAVVDNLIKKHLISEVIPLLISLKNLMVKTQSPLQSELNITLLHLCYNYKDNLNEIIEDPRIVKEMLHDYKTFSVDEE